MNNQITINALNNYLKTLKKRNVNIEYTPVSHIDLYYRLPQIMAIALWQKDNSENEDVQIMIDSFNSITLNKKIA